eukprot:CAMPEP_0195572936 /NCGR_PEP_ID=MMETSP0814-20130614/5026_1 /TAXON_ID=97485 /ORGANISM="Prymnesium parvum, Strain Texoma1" /LENGTH=153 /DNA_ID=CAMNT_0040708747 /DNA_START=182 /DNA_END=644 /DNA_ORIENTATION=-
MEKEWRQRISLCVAFVLLNSPHLDQRSHARRKTNVDNPIPWPCDALETIPAAEDERQQQLAAGRRPATSRAAAADSLGVRLALRRRVGLIDDGGVELDGLVEKRPVPRAVARRDGPAEVILARPHRLPQVLPEAGHLQVGVNVRRDRSLVMRG